DSELVTFTVCALAQTASATMKTTTSGLCQLESAATATPTISANSRKNRAVHQIGGETGCESRPGSASAVEVVDASAATGRLAEGNRSKDLSALIRRSAHRSMLPPQRKQVSVAGDADMRRDNQHCRPVVGDPRAQRVPDYRRDSICPFGIRIDTGATSLDLD